MTDNRTTELLRKLLEERGLSYQTHYLHTSWHVGPKLYDAVDNLDGTLTISSLTPEQAIAATLGSGTLTAEQVRELIAPHLHARPTFDFGRHGAVWRADFQAIADELNSVLGEQPAKSGADALSRRARDMARNIQGNLGRCLYRRKDVAEMEEVSETLMELANELNATLGSGTCENKAKHWGEFECSECGFYADFGSDLHRVNRCPDCGKAVTR